MSRRNEQDIHEALARAENKCTISLELNEESVSDAISTYIRYKLQPLAQEEKYDNATRHDVEECLFANADGTFLWVALVCAQLKKVPVSMPVAELLHFLQDSTGLVIE